MAEFDSSGIGVLQPANIGGSLAQGFQVGQASALNQIQRETAQQELETNKYKLEQSKAMQDLKIKALTDPAAATVVAQLDPEYGAKIQEYHAKKAEYYGSQARAILDLPLAMRNDAYANLYNNAKQGGEDVAMFPVPEGEWNDVKEKALQFVTNSSVGAKEQLDNFNKEREFRLKEREFGLKQAEFGLKKKESELTRGGEKAPQGYRYTANGDLEAIPGGPAAKLSAESAGKVALIKQGEKDIERFKKLITEKDGSFNRTKLAALNTYGSLGVRTERSTLFNAVNARLRLESGAAVPESEVERAMDAFAPKATDSDATIKSKIERMSEFFGLAKEEIGQGRGSKPANSKTSESDPLGLFN